MNIPLILTTNYPGAQWVLTGEEYAGLEWLDESPKPTEKELLDQSAAVEYQTAYNAVSAARQAAYQATSDPIFFQAQRGEKTQQEWLDAVQAINDANPYPAAPKAKK
jgi:hypothetical protein